jgi:hypothetical protein
MTTLATHPTADPHQLALIADDWTPTRKPFTDAFRDACRAEADAHGGWVNPNAVRARLIAEFGEDGYNPRQLSALWSSSCGRDGFMDVCRDVLVPIEGPGSRGNGGKSVPMRRWVG